METERSKFQLQLSPKEHIVQRYDFMSSNSGREDSLIITEDRLIRRVASIDYLSQQEMRLSDLNRISSVCKTNRYATTPKTDPKTYIFMGIGALLALIGIILLFAARIRLPGILLLLVGLGLMIGSRFIRKKSQTRQETVLSVSFYERLSNHCVITIEKKMEDKAEAVGFANEIGIILTKVAPRKVEINQEEK